MKRCVALFLTFCVLFLSGCGPEEPQHTELFPPQEFSHYYRLLPENSGSKQLIAHISVERVWDGMYAMDDFPDSDPCHIVAECTLEKVFYSNRTLRDEGTGHMACEGDTWYLWINLPRRDQGESSLRQLLETADSFVIDGHQTGPNFRPGSEMWERILTEYDSADFAPDEYRRVEPAVMVNNLITWSLIPVVDGRVNTDAMKQTVDALYDSEYPMMFSLDKADPENGLYFQNGSTTEELYTALDRYVGEYRPD